MRSWRPAISLLAACLVPLIGLIRLLPMLASQAADDDPFAGSQVLLRAGLITVVIALAAAAVYFWWGRYSIYALGLNGTTFRGVGPFGAHEHFPWRAVNGVCLTTELTDEDQEKRVVRLEGVGFHQSIGAILTDAQRVYIALFLLRKISEIGQPAAAGAVQSSGPRL